jgi:hypothetical protein
MGEAIRRLSNANAGAAAELKLISILSKGIVLSRPAQPPVKKGSGTLLYEREPTLFAPLNTVIVVAFETGTALRIAYPNPTLFRKPGSVNVKKPLGSPTATTLGGSILFVTPEPPLIVTAPLPKL